LFRPAYGAATGEPTSRRRAGGRRHRVRLAAVALLGLGLTFTVMLASASSAQAKIPIVGEIPVVGEVVEGIAGAGQAVLNPTEAVLKGFIHLLQAIFGGVEAKLINEVIAGLLAIPNFNSGHVAGLERTTVAIAAGMLTAVLTLSILRFYIAGLTNSASGGFEALQGVVRVVGAVGFIVLWPGIYGEVVQIPSAFNHALLGSASVQHNVALLFDAALTVGTGAFALNAGLGLIFVILIGLVSAVVFLSLLWMKVLLSVMLMFLYVAMPLCVVLWPIPELAWLASSALKALTVAVIAPSVWAILFSLSSAINTDVLTWAPSHSLIDTVIIRPLAGITVMLLCITIPRFLMRTALIGPGGQPGGWRVWRTITFGMFAARAASGGAQTVATAAVEGHPKAKRMIDALPTPIKPPGKGGEGSLASRVVFGRSGFVPEQDDSEKVPPPRVSAPGAQPGQAHASDRTPSPRERPAEQPAGSAQPRQSSAQGQVRAEEVNQAGASMYQQAHSGLESSSADDVRAAMGRLTPDTQRRLAEIRASNPDRLRDSIAHSLPSAGWTDAEREALRTIGSARMKEVEEGMNLAASDLTGTPAAPAAQPGVAPVPSPAVPRPPATSPPPSGSTPPSGSRSLGADLREQRPIAGDDPAPRKGGLIDPEPFRD